MTSDEIVDEVITSLGRSVFRLARAPEFGHISLSGNSGFGHDLRAMKMITKERNSWCLTPLGRAIRQRLLDDPRHLVAARAKADAAQKQWEADMAKLFNRKFPEAVGLAQ